jgi:hypothetical protein
MYRVLITGSRDWFPTDLIESILERLRARHGAALLIVHGACSTGVDATFRAACESAGVDQERHPAAWQDQGKAAGPIRNSAMVRMGADICLAFSRDIAWSKGTADCARKAIRAGIPTWLIGEDGQPVRLEKV